ncbi:MAG: hypothetical protein IPH55_16665 [Betaproteobacteria bacterium]|nr:hypothetical protein [Betaproteobacteria bacterium]
MGDAGFGISVHGVTRTFNGSSQRIFRPYTTTPTAITLFALANCTNQTATNTLVALGAPNAGFMMLDLSGTESDDPLRFYLYDGTALKQTYSFSPIYNQYVAFCGVAPPVGGTLVAYQNGVLRSHDIGANTGYVFNSVVDVSVGSNYVVGSGAYNYLNGSVAVACFWDRALSADEVREVSLNPWQLFAPDSRRIYFGASGGGATTTTIEPSKGSLAVAGYAPGIAQPRTIAPSKGAATLTGYAPGIEQDKAVAPAKGALTLTGYVPTLTQPRTIAAVKGALSLAGYAPGISQSASGTIAPSAGALLLTGHAPGLEQDRNVAPSVGRVDVDRRPAGHRPERDDVHRAEQGRVGAAGLHARRNDDGQSSDCADVRRVAAGWLRPVLAQTGAQIIGPIKGALTLAGHAPTVQVIGAGVTVVEPSQGALSLSGYAPLIGVILAADAPDSTRLIDRDPARLGTDVPSWHQAAPRLKCAIFLVSGTPRWVVSLHAGARSCRGHAGFRDHAGRLPGRDAGWVLTYPCTAGSGERRSRSPASPSATIIAPPRRPPPRRYTPRASTPTPRTSISAPSISRSSRNRR